MAYEGWLEYDGVEVINLARTYYLSRALGVNSVSPMQQTAAEAIRTALGATAADYGNPLLAPWYDAGVPASVEFAGFIPLDMRGLGDASVEAEVTEYITAGGAIGQPRSATVSIVGNVVIVAKTPRGAEYGLRWLRRVFARKGTFCAGSNLRYFRSPRPDASTDIVHRRDVRMTRSPNVNKERRGVCSFMNWVGFTLTCGDPYEYGAAMPRITNLGANPVAGAGVTSFNANPVVITEAGCPVYDYSPMYDPQYPALVAPPTAPDFLPDGWGIEEGMLFQRRWARINPIEPSGLVSIPLLRLSSTTEARRVRISIFPASAQPTDLCGALFTAVVAYLPAGQTLYIDAEQGACYIWNGLTSYVRRADSVVYGAKAYPLTWPVLTENAGYLVTMDAFALPGNIYEGGGNLRLALDLIPRSD